MPQIAISNSKGRDASVVAESVRVPMRMWWIDVEDRIATSAKILKGTIDRDYDALLQKFGTPEKVAEAMLDADPEIDLESVGRYLRETSRVYVNSDRQVVYGVNQVEVVRNPDGTEKLRRPKKLPVPNVSPEQPLLWSGKLLAKKEVFNKFVMVSKLQLVHINGLTYDFLYDIAKELEAKQSKACCCSVQGQSRINRSSCDAGRRRIAASSKAAHEVMNICSFCTSRTSN